MDEASRSRELTLFIDDQYDAFPTLDPYCRISAFYCLPGILDLV